jgi:hypothetical protein
MAEKLWGLSRSVLRYHGKPHTPWGGIRGIPVQSHKADPAINAKSTKVPLRCGQKDI